MRHMRRCRLSALVTVAAVTLAVSTICIPSASGWGDTYVQTVAGQAFDITNVPNGRHKIAVRVNPLGLLHETSNADDIAVRRIRLTGRWGARQVVVAPWRGING